jgi:hypothetical protein
MKLTDAELAYVRSLGIYVTSKCDGCPKVLNQSFRHTIAGKPEVYCSADCRDRVFFGEGYRPRKPAGQQSNPCAYCGGEKDGKRSDSAHCSNRCKQAFWRLAEKTRKSDASRNSDLALSMSCEGEKVRQYDRMQTRESHTDLAVTE